MIDNGHDLSTWCRTCQDFGTTLRYEDLLARFGPDFLVVHVPMYLRCRDCDTNEAEIRIKIRDLRMGTSRPEPSPY